MGPGVAVGGGFAFAFVDAEQIGQRHTGIQRAADVDDAAQATAFREKLDARNVNCGQRTGTYPQYHRDYVKNGRAHAPGASPFRGLEPWPAPGYRAEDFPRTEQLTRRFVAIPLGWLYTIEDADHIAASISASPA